MNNFWQRALTGTIFVGVIVGATMVHSISFLVLLLLICYGALIEYYTIVLEQSLKVLSWIFIFLGCFLVATVEVWQHTNMALFGMAILFALLSFAILLSGERSWKRISLYISGLLYIAIPLSLFYFTSFRYIDSALQYDYRLPLNLFILIWSSDTFAYVSGKSLGKHKLFEAVSPNKTWEGFFGGGLLTFGFSFLLAYLWDLPYHVNAIVAICTIIFGTLGDLVESLLKREFNIKDSGTILPGHGGILDRFDALLLSLPFTSCVYYLLLR